MQGTDQKVAQCCHCLGQVFKAYIDESKQLLLN